MDLSVLPRPDEAELDMAREGTLWRRLGNLNLDLGFRSKHLVRNRDSPPPASVSKVATAREAAYRPVCHGLLPPGSRVHPASIDALVTSVQTWERGGQVGCFV